MSASNGMVSRRDLLKAGGIAGLATAGVAALPALASEKADKAANADASEQIDLHKVNPDYLMTEDEGREWHEYKATLGPLYPGYEHFDEYLNFIKDKLTEYGCVDYTETRWPFESYRVNDWPDHDSGVLGLTVDGEELPVGTFLMLSASSGEEGVTGEMVFFDLASDEEPKEGAFEGKIVVMKPKPIPEPPYSTSFLESYAYTDTNYRTDPEPPAGLLEFVDPTINCSWNTRWDFGQWGTMNEYAETGKAAALICLSALTYGCLEGLYDRQDFRASHPAIVVDRVTAQVVEEAAKAGKTATVKLISEFFDTENWNFLYFLPGKDYGTDADDYITINTHSDAMALTQDNGALGALGIARYFSHIPQEQRPKTIVFNIDTRHFVEGFEAGNFEHDPYQVYPEVTKKVSVTLGMEHMGEMEGAEDYENNKMVPTGRPEYSFMKADDNDWCARVLIQAAADSGLERADVKIDGRPGNAGLYKSRVRSVQAYCHNLDVAIIGEAGNWPGAHTQTFSTMDYFGSKKFRDEVHLWTQVVSNLMSVDRIVYDVVWSDINTAIRALGAAELITPTAMEGMLKNASDIFAHVEEGEYEMVATRLANELKANCAYLAPEGTDLDGEYEIKRNKGILKIVEGQEWQSLNGFIDTAIEMCQAKAAASAK